MTQMKKKVLQPAEELSLMSLEIDTDIGGFAYYSFHFIAKSDVGQTVGEVIINDNGEDVDCSITYTTIPEDVEPSEIITMDTEHRNGRRVMVYTAPIEVEFFYRKNLAFG